MREIATIGATLSGNKGAASMLQSVLDNLPPLLGEVHFNVLSVYPAEDEQLAKDPRNYAYFNNRAFDLARWYHRNEELMRILPAQHKEAIAPALIEESYLYGTPLGQGSWGDPLYERGGHTQGGGRSCRPPCGTGGSRCGGCCN